MQSLKDKVIVITGSTGGLGNGVAEACLEEGAKLALMDVNEETLAQQMSVLGNIHNVRSWVVDVRNMESLQQAMDEAAAYFGGIDIVFANAGITAFAPMETMQPDVFERVIDINLTGVWRTFHAAIPHIKKSKGYLLATASMASCNCWTALGGALLHPPTDAAHLAAAAHRCCTSMLQVP